MWGSYIHMNVYTITIKKWLYICVPCSSKLGEASCTHINMCTLCTHKNVCIITIQKWLCICVLLLFRIGGSFLYTYKYVDHTYIWMSVLLQSKCGCIYVPFCSSDVGEASCTHINTCTMHAYKYLCYYNQKMALYMCSPALPNWRKLSAYI